MEKKGARPFGIRDKLGYLFGDFGNDFTFLLSSSFLLKFYTDVMGVNAGIVGTVMMIARIVDAFTDVTMGRICDRSRYTKNGKFKPWILRMCGPVAIASFLMYQSSLADSQLWVKILYLTVTYLLWGSVFYTSINIPYGSMASAISANPDDRQSLSGFRTMGGALAGAFVTAGIPLVAYEKNEELGIDIMVGSRFTVIAGVCSILAVGCYLLCYFLTTERVKIEVSEEQRRENNVLVMLKNAFRNRALLSIIAASIVMLLAQLTIQQMANYVFPIYYGNADLQTISMVPMGVGMVIAAALAKPISKKIGKAELSVATNLVAGIVFVVLFFLRPSNPYAYMVFQLIAWMGLGAFQMVCWALITDVIDHSEIKNGIREDGSVYAMYSFARKLGQAASAGLTGWLLELIGYTTPEAVTASIKDGIFNISTLIPGISLILLAIILWFWYPLHKKRVEENVKILAEKHKNN